MISKKETYVSPTNIEAGLLGPFSPSTLLHQQPTMEPSSRRPILVWLVTTYCQP
ncbi:15475_t:CDS:2 [Funneliformis caledonium]|uniref:15475_t:CDS:1 n=1 Tax=Funneliformis caledonium TaxID=1117310 RepID=A0A9N9CVR4_9GLOM|nr:15475_t:CDS:2 [Funneliformis caledonium]